MRSSETTVVRRNGKEYTVFAYCIACKLFESKSLLCRAFTPAVKKPTIDTDRAYKYDLCGDWKTK